MIPVILLAAWVLSAMHALVPRAPWLDSYPSTALAIAAASESAPLFAGDAGPRRTAALLLAVARHESSFDPAALGDRGASVGLFQVNPSTAEKSRAELLDPASAAPVAAELLRRSMRACAARPLPERLSWYAGGGPSCPATPGALRASREMMSIAAAVFGGKGTI